MENLDFKEIDDKSYPILREFLMDCKLPSEDIGSPRQSFYGLFNKSVLVGSVGIEIYGRAGLFRSLGVSSDIRNRGLGKILYNRIIEHCLQNGIKSLFLLTTTASDYFGKLGWKIISRDDVPADIKQSEEFASICPSSAICMQMEVFENNQDYAVKIFKAGFNCAQAVFVPFAIEKGFPVAEAFRISTGFGAGMVYRGETCGAITGAMMALGLKYGRDHASDSIPRDKTYALINKLYDKFKEKHGTILCKELLKADISNPEELKRVGKAGYFSTLCPNFVRDAAFITGTLFEE